MVFRAVVWWADAQDGAAAGSRTKQETLSAGSSPIHAALLTGGAEVSRDLAVPGGLFAACTRDESCRCSQGRRRRQSRPIRDDGKHVIGSAGATPAVTAWAQQRRCGKREQFELMPSEAEEKPLDLANWQYKLRTDPPEEGCGASSRSPQASSSAQGQGTALGRAHEWQGAQMVEVPGSSRNKKASGLSNGLVDRRAGPRGLGVEKDGRARKGGTARKAVQDDCTRSPTPRQCAASRWGLGDPRGPAGASAWTNT